MVCYAQSCAEGRLVRVSLEAGGVLRESGTVV